MSDAEFPDLKASAQEALAHARKEKRTLRTYELPVRASKVISPQRIKSIRKKLNVSQPVFADLLYVTKDTAAKWEQGVRKPSGSALRLLQIAEKNPDVLLAS